MSDEFKPYFQHRRNLPLRDDGGTRDFLIELIDELLDLEAQTHPSAGPCPTKDELSRCTSMRAGDLLEILIGWAVDHQIGLVLNGMPGGAAVPPTNLISENVERADDHNNEATAPAYIVPETDIKTDRQMLRSLLNSAPQSLFPGKLLADVIPALKALDLGEEPEFFRPTRIVGKEGKTYQKWRLRLKAAQHVEFLRGMKESRTDAVADAAEAYGVASRTIEGWITELPHKLDGIDHVAEEKQYAKQRGKNARELAMRGDDRLVEKEAKSRRKNGEDYQRLMEGSEAKVVTLRN